ncbi:complement decay-accelerating factor isoform X2 [Pempheris klunzingeri]|uniref:complement decay-accelerating factor isoform X2 n=1 Tax=Pempheris klunzingeri TaxID=3127111 RepID=UPI00397F3027
MDPAADTCGRRRVRALLVIYLFVVRAAAECPKPQGWGNIVLTDEALLMNTFPEDVEVTLECANGYVKENGFGIITCKGGNWTEPSLICKKKDCGPPRVQPNMSFNISAGTLFGATIHVICDKGYQISGTAYKQCYASGWGGRAACGIVECDTPPEVTNGRSSWDSQDDPQYGEIIQYICNEGYTLVGNDSIMCSETSEYDSPPPECKGVTTKDIVTPTALPPAQEASTTSDSSVAPTAHSDKPMSAVPPVSPASPSVRGGRDIFTAEGKATTISDTSVTPSSFQEMHDGDVDIAKDIGYTPVIISVIIVSVVSCIVVFIFHKFLLKRKGSANGTSPIC